MGSLWAAAVKHREPEIPSMPHRVMGVEAAAVANVPPGRRSPQRTAEPAAPTATPVATLRTPLTNTTSQPGAAVVPEQFELLLEPLTDLLGL